MALVAVQIERVGALRTFVLQGRLQMGGAGYASGKGRCGENRQKQSFHPNLLGLSRQSGARRYWRRTFGFVDPVKFGEAPSPLPFALADQTPVTS